MWFFNISGLIKKKNAIMKRIPFACIRKIPEWNWMLLVGIPTTSIRISAVDWRYQINGPTCLVVCAWINFTTFCLVHLKKSRPPVWYRVRSIVGSYFIFSVNILLKRVEKLRWQGTWCRRVRSIQKAAHKRKNILGRNSIVQHYCWCYFKLYLNRNRNISGE